MPVFYSLFKKFCRLPADRELRSGFFRNLSAAEAFGLQSDILGFFFASSIHFLRTSSMDKFGTSSLIKIFVREYLTNNLLGLYSGIEGVPVLSAKSRLGVFNEYNRKNLIYS